VLLTVPPYPPLVYYTTGMANLKISVSSCRSLCHLCRRVLVQFFRLLPKIQRRRYVNNTCCKSLKT